MGCDGGSIPKRAELVKTQKAQERPDARSQLLAQWFHCALSKQPLQTPVVACLMGKLYNKDAILEFLLNRGGYGDGDMICGHVQSLKDITTLNLTPNPAYSANDTSNTCTITLTTVEKPLTSQFLCPITGREMNGIYRFSYIRTCGCVFFENAFKEVPSVTCLKCGKDFKTEDIVPLNPVKPEEIERCKELIVRAKAERELELEEKRRKKAEKKGKKEKERVKTGDTDEGAIDSGHGGSGSGSGSDDGAASKKRKRDKESSLSAKKAATESVRSKINMALPDLNDRSTLPKGMRVQSEAIKSLYVKRDKDGKVVGEEKGNYLTKGTFNRFAASF